MDTFFDQFRYTKTTTPTYRLTIYKPLQVRSHIKKNKKQFINQRLRHAVWKAYMGEVYSALCYCCGQTKIDVTCFQAGHVIAEANGGETTMQNLRPICGLCNQSGSIAHMKDFAIKNGFNTAGIVIENNN
jgi:hypothetical protein